MHAITMDTISLEVGTAALFLLQDRVVVVLMDRGSLDRVVVVLMELGSLLLVTIGQFELEHNPLEGVGRDLLLVETVVD